MGNFGAPNYEYASLKNRKPTTTFGFRFNEFTAADKILLMPVLLCLMTW